MATINLPEERAEGQDDVFEDLRALPDGNLTIQTRLTARAGADFEPGSHRVDAEFVLLSTEITAVYPPIRYGKICLAGVGRMVSPYVSKLE